MKKASNSILLLALFFNLIALASSNGPSRSALDSIRPADVRKHIDFLASDLLKGRNTPSEGLNIAADYLAAEFKRYGLEPLSGSYFQEFNVNRVRLGEENYLKLTETGQPGISFRIKREFMPYGFTANSAAVGGLIFAGYGITAPEFNYDDYQNIDVKDKVVLIFRHEPAEKDSTSVFDGMKSSAHFQLRSKVENAIAHGAAALLVVNDPLNHRSMRPRGFPWPSLYKNIPADAVPLTLSLSEAKKIPVVQVGKKFINQIFGSVDSLKAIQKEIDSSLETKSFEIANFTVNLKTSTKIESETTKNVVALWEGSDPKLKNEAIVIGAHYDHVGINEKDFKPNEDNIFNGADDNASGTVGLLEIAEAFSLAPRTKRSIIFIAFAGEEKGLFGSRVYVERPLWSLTDTKAMFNMDMIGRNDGEKVSIVGYTRSPDLNEINTRENKFVGLTLEYNAEQFFRRSDQYNFARKKIPVLFYHTGEHEDYHKVTDHSDKINEGKIAMIAKLLFRTAWQAANTNQTFKYIEQN